MVSRASTTIGTATTRGICAASALEGRRQRLRAVRGPRREHDHGRLHAPERRTEVGHHRRETPSRFPASTNASRSRISSSSARDRTSASPSRPGDDPRTHVPAARAANANEAAAEHAPVERRPGAAGIPGGVHHDREAPRLFLFELADHDRAGARGGRPVHVAHAVAGAVLADPQVLGPLAATRRVWIAWSVVAAGSMNGSGPSELDLAAARGSNPPPATHRRRSATPNGAADFTRTRSGP